MEKAKILIVDDHRVVIEGINPSLTLFSQKATKNG